MRDLIDLLESVGLANRKPGDRWQNAQGEELIFSDLTFYPEQGGRYDTPEEFQAALDQAVGQRGITAQDLIWAVAPKSTGGFGIAHFVDPANQDYYFARYLRQVSPFRQQNDFDNTLPGGYRLQTAAAKKEQSGYKPSEVLGARMDDLTPNDIYAAVVAKFGQDSDEARAMAAFMASDGEVTFPLGNMNFTAFTNYFCEMLQPMSLVMGKKREGNADQAEADYLTEGGYDTCRISFSTKQNQGLFDSRVTNPAGQSIGISTKVKSGADAAVKNLSDKIREMQATEAGKKILKKYPKEISMLDIIEEGGYVNAPLNLGVLFKIITPDQADEIRALRGKTAGQMRLGAANKRLYRERLEEKKIKDPSRVVPFFHMLAAVAFKVADHVNENTNFGRVAATILNHGAFMTSRTYASQSGANVVLKPFSFEYPSEAVTDVLIKADKNYYSTDNKGNFTFKILKNGATDQDTQVQDRATDTKPDMDLDAYSQKRAPVTARSRGATKPEDDAKILGRKRRKPQR